MNDFARRGADGADVAQGGNVGGRLLAVALLIAAVGVGACGDTPETNGSTGSAEQATQAQRTAEPTTRSETKEQPGTSEADSLPADQAGSDKDQIKALLEQQHQAFLAGDADAYCQALTDELRTALDGCEFIEAALQSQQDSGGMVEDQEILELTMESDKAYAAVYEQQDTGSSEKTPADFELTKVDGAWRISLTRYRTEREAGPAKCFVGGSFNDLC